MVDVVLFRPEIPQNTGNIGRLCAITGGRLHLIHPLGFQLTEKNLRRSGMDYWKDLEVFEYENWEAFYNSTTRPERLWLFTTKASKDHWEGDYQKGDGLVFGSEGKGCTEEVHEGVGGGRSVKIPHYVEGTRSINLATSAGIGVYEALRQINT